MSDANNKPIDIKKSLIDTVLAGLIALIVFGPIVGVVLEGYSYNLQPTRVAWMVGAVMIGRLVLSLFLQTAKGVKVQQSFEVIGSGVHVLPPDYKSRLRLIIPGLIVIAIVFPIFADKYLLTVVILAANLLILATVPAYNLSVVRLKARVSMLEAKLSGQHRPQQSQPPQKSP